MNQPPPVNQHVSKHKPWLYLTIGFIAGIVVTIGCLAVVAGTYFLVNTIRSGEKAVAPDVNVEIRVASDGCTVERGEVIGKTPMASLTWTITDSEGNLVLERNAEGEYEYRYFRNGKYFVQIKGWNQGAYHWISDQVEIDC